MNTTMILAPMLSLFFFGHAVTAAVEKPTKRNAVTLESSANYTELQVAPLYSASPAIVFAPNTNGRYGLTLNLWGASAFFGSIQGGSEQEEARYGKTTFLDYRLFFPLGAEDNWFVSAYFGSYTGLHVKNTALIDPSRTDKITQIQRPDLSLTQTGGELYYVFSPKDFSLAAGLFQSSRQSSPGGSFILSIASETTQIKGDELVPAVVQSNFSSDGKMTSGLFKSAIINAGFGVSTVSDKTAFITLIALGGLGYQTQSYTTSDSSITQSHANVEKLSGILVIGQNNDKGFYGVSGSVEQIIFKTSSIRFTREMSNLKLFLGIRF